MSDAGRTRAVLRVAEQSLLGRATVLVARDREDREAVLDQVGEHLRRLSWLVLTVAASPGGETSSLLPLSRAGLMPAGGGRLRGLNGVTEHLVGAVQRGRTVLLVRDHHLLDPATRAVLDAVRLRTGVALVATSETAADVHMTAGPVSVVVAPRPTISELAAELSTSGGQGLSRLDVARLHAYCGGSAALARALIEDVRAGTAEGGAATDEVHQGGAGEVLLEARIGGLSESERRALDLLALLGPSSVQAVVDRVGETVLERLEQAGLIELVSPCGQVLVHPPVLGDHLRRTVGGLRRRALLGADVEEEGSSTPVWGAGHGADAVARLVVEKEAHRVEHARADWLRRPDLTSAVELAAALTAAGRRREAGQVLGAAEHLIGQHDAAVHWHAQHWEHVLHESGDRRAAIAGLRRAAKEVIHHSELLRSRADLLEHEHSDVRRRELERLLDPGPLDPRIAGELGGRLERLRLGSLEHPDAAAVLGRQPVHGPGEGVTAGVLAMLSGRPAQSTRLLVEALAGAVATASRAAIRRALAAQVLVELLGGRGPTAAARSLGAALGLPLGLLASSREKLELALHVAVDDDASPVPASVGPVERAELHLRRGEALAAFVVAVVALEDGDDHDPEPPLVAILEGAQQLRLGDLATLHLAAVRARAEGSPDAVRDAREELERFGLVGAAARMLPVADPGARPRRHAAAAFTARELEVARMVASGCSNRQIAEGLVLSVRTVETHVLRVMRKAGLTARSQIRGLLVAPEGPSGARPPT